MKFETFVFFILHKNSLYLPVVVPITAFACAYKLDYTCDLISVDNLCDQTFCYKGVHSSQIMSGVKAPQWWIAPFWPHWFNVTSQGSIKTLLNAPTDTCMHLYLVTVFMFCFWSHCEQQAGNHKLNFFVCLSMNFRTCSFWIIIIPGIIFCCVQINTLYDGLF